MTERTFVFRITLKMLQVTAVVFDLDGTLLDSAADLMNAANRVLGDLGLDPLALKEFRHLFGGGVEALICRALAARGYEFPDLESLRRRFLEYYAADLTTCTKPYPGTREMLEALQSRSLKLAVCTNKPNEPARSLLKALALERYFSAIVGGDSLPFRKPDPHVLLELLRLLGTTPSSSLLVGDSEVDAEMAAAACVPFVLMTHGYHRGPVAQIPRTAAFDQFDELSEFLCRSTGDSPR